jgi:hypothetical protein
MQHIGWLSTTDEALRQTFASLLTSSKKTNGLDLLLIRRPRLRVVGSFVPGFLIRAAELAYRELQLSLHEPAVADHDRLAS